MSTVTRRSGQPPLPKERARAHVAGSWLLASLFLVLAAATPAHADIGIIVMEPVGALGFFTRVGHAATYLSNICPDGSAVRMRLCRPGESGGVVSRYAPLSEHEDYDWAIVPFEEFLHGFHSPALAPLIGTPELQKAIEASTFEPLFSTALERGADAALPAGQWTAALATRFDRSLYILSVATTPTDDAAIVAAFNEAPNKSRFNFFYRNCSDQAKAIFDLALSRGDAIGGRTTGLTMQTPKGLARSLVMRGLEHPELRLRVRYYPQLAGTYRRSRPVLFPMENTYRNVGFAPYWFFGGYSQVALGAMFYHEVLDNFRLTQATKDFVSPLAAQLTVEQHRLRQGQDDSGRALASARNRDAAWATPAAANTEAARRLGEIRRLKQAEAARVMGSKAQWAALDRDFRAVAGGIGAHLPIPDALQRYFSQAGPGGRLSARVLDYLEANGTFYVDKGGRGPWLRLRLEDGEPHLTGLSSAHVLSGDARVAVLVLATVLDHNLSQPESSREDFAYMSRLLALFRHASASLQQSRTEPPAGPGPPGRPDPGLSPLGPPRRAGRSAASR